MSHQKGSTFENERGIFIANTAGTRSAGGAINARLSAKNRKRIRPKYYPNTEDGEVAAQNQIAKNSTEADDVRQRNSEGRKDRVSTQPHHKTHLSKAAEKKVREEFRKRKREEKKKKKKKNNKS